MNYFLTIIKLNFDLKYCFFLLKNLIRFFNFQIINLNFQAYFLMKDFIH